MSGCAPPLCPTAPQSGADKEGRLAGLSEAEIEAGWRMDEMADGRSVVVKEWLKAGTYDGLPHQARDKKYTWEVIRDEGCQSYLIDRNTKYMDAMRARKELAQTVVEEKHAEATGELLQQSDSGVAASEAANAPAADHAAASKSVAASMTDSRTAVDRAGAAEEERRRGEATLTPNPAIVSGRKLPPLDKSFSHRLFNGAGLLDGTVPPQRRGGSSQTVV